MSCLETAWVMGYSRVPDPPARMIPFIPGAYGLTVHSQTKEYPLRTAHSPAVFAFRTESP